MNIRPVGAELFRVDGRTDMTKLIVALGNFANAPKNVCKCTAVKQVYIYGYPMAIHTTCTKRPKYRIILSREGFKWPGIFICCNVSPHFL